MIRPMQLMRLLKINIILIRYTFKPSIVGEYSLSLRLLSYLNPFHWLGRHRSRGESLRIALEKLGPIFVKFGQLLSTRQDLFSDDIISELSLLQDNVPPYPTAIAKTIIEKAFKTNVQALFAYFSETPLASASIAQVYAATLHDGSDVIVKILRPQVEKVIRQDVALMYLAAQLTEYFWRQGKRLRLVALVAEFERTIIDELDLMREAANASQLRRNFSNSIMMYVPKIYWEYTRTNVMVMERIYGVRVSDVHILKEHHTNLKKLAEYGVEIFFTQVFRDSFFHADMHPGNVFVDIKDPANPKYIGVDFGIMGTLSAEDLQYLAENLLAFFNRDYRRVAQLHVLSGWVSFETRVEQFESAIRTVCEPIFEKPIRDISFGQLLLRLFQTAERFNMQVQPQLMLLQKTLLSIEGLGRRLYPELDLWQTARPFMIRWMKAQKGVKSILQQLSKDWQNTMASALQTPQLLQEVLTDIRYRQRTEKPLPINLPVAAHASGRKNLFYGVAVTFGIITVSGLFIHNIPPRLLAHWPWATLSIGFVAYLIGLSYKK